MNRENISFSSFSTLRTLYWWICRLILDSLTWFLPSCATSKTQNFFCYFTSTYYIKFIEAYGQTKTFIVLAFKESIFVKFHPIYIPA